MGQKQTEPTRPPFYRVRRLREDYGWSKAWIFSRLADGSLRGLKVGGVLMVDGASVREMLEGAEPWRPRPRAS